MIDFQTLPQDNQKIRSLMGGSLYAYELPPIDEIEPISAEEEMSERKSVTVGLNEIQRGITTPSEYMPIANICHWQAYELSFLWRNKFSYLKKVFVKERLVFFLNIHLSFC